MGYWGVKSYEEDEADFALDAGFEAVHGDRYTALMDDRNPLTLEQVQQQLADPRTLAAALAALIEQWPEPLEDWDDEQKIAYVGAVVRHAELGVSPPAEVRDRALAWLAAEDIDWEDQAEARRKRRAFEDDLLRNLTTSN